MYCEWYNIFHLRKVRIGIWIIQVRYGNISHNILPRFLRYWWRGINWWGIQYSVVNTGAWRAWRTFLHFRILPPSEKHLRCVPNVFQTWAQWAQPKRFLTSLDVSWNHAATIGHKASRETEADDWELILNESYPVYLQEFININLITFAATLVKLHTNIGRSATINIITLTTTLMGFPCH